MKCGGASLKAVLALVVAPALIFLCCSIGFAQSPDHKRAPAVVSIGGDITEIIYALGEADRIVAVDATSQFPASALKDKRNVGYMRALSTEGVLSVGAQMAIASERAGPPEVVKLLKSTLTYVEIPEGATAEGVPLKVEAVARALGTVEQGAALAAKIRNDLAQLAVETKTISRPLRALFVLTVQSGRVTVGGSDTSADAVIKLAGLINVAATISGFKPVSDEALIGMQPDVVVVMQRSSSAHDGAEALSIPSLARSPAAREGRLVVMDGLLLLGFGPRVADAARHLMQSAYKISPAAKGGSK